jgi:hypothetical protein
MVESKRVVLAIAAGVATAVVIYFAAPSDMSAFKQFACVAVVSMLGWKLPDLLRDRKAAQAPEVGITKPSTATSRASVSSVLRYVPGGTVVEKIVIIALVVAAVAGFLKSALSTQA